MAEKVVTVCDICSKPATETVTLKTTAGNRTKDLCSIHLQELLKGSRAPKRGRRPGATAASASSTSGAKTTTTRRRSTPKKAAARKKVTARKTMARKKTAARPGYSVNGKRLGRPPASKAKKSRANSRATA